MYSLQVSKKVKSFLASQIPTIRFYFRAMNRFENLASVIRSRRSVKPGQMNGRKIDKAVIQQLIELADWAPTHAHTEPWHFIVYGGESVKEFCSDHANLYKTIAPADKFNTATYEKLLHNGDKVSHIIAVIMQRGDNPKIPVLEEIAAVSAAVQNILLGAEALGVAVLWSTGGLTHQPAMKQYLHLKEEDVLMGFLYLGYADDISKEGKRIVPLHQKIEWK